jgi:hypothetical protein
MSYKLNGHGYYWRAELIGGPFDGLMDKVIQMRGSNPPLHMYRMVTVLPEEKPSLGSKLIEEWGKKHVPPNTRVAVYELTTEGEVEENEIIKYSYCETTTIKEYKENYI